MECALWLEKESRYKCGVSMCDCYSHSGSLWGWRTMTNYTSCSRVPVPSWCSFYLHPFSSVEAVSPTALEKTLLFLIPSPCTYSTRCCLPHLEKELSPKNLICSWVVVEWTGKNQQWMGCLYGGGCSFLVPNWEVAQCGGSYGKPSVRRYGGGEADMFCCIR